MRLELSSMEPATIFFMEPELPPGTSATKLFEDKTPNAIILNRILLNSLNVAAHDDLEQAEGSELIDLMCSFRESSCRCGRLHAYQAQERALAEQAATWPGTRRQYSQELYEEFDVFSVQIKSTLDHLVQIMRPILGRNKWTMYSFGDKGDRVLAALQRNTSKHHAGHVRMMEHHLFNERNKSWLTLIIDARDQVNHGMAGGMKIERFADYRDPGGIVHLPMWNNQPRLADGRSVRVRVPPGDARRHNHRGPAGGDKRIHSGIRLPGRNASRHVLHVAGDEPRGTRSSADDRRTFFV